MTDTPKHSVSVAGIIVNDDGRVLVIQRRDNSHWEPPGGVLELNETPEEGVRREVLEETGVTVSVDHLSGVYKNMERGIVALVFRCSINDGRPSISDEARKVRWMTREEVQRSMTDAYSIRVIDAFESDVKVRVHNGVVLSV